MTDIPIDPPAQRLTVIAEQLDGKLIAGAFDGAAPDEIRELVTLGRVLRGIAREIAPRLTGIATTAITSGINTSIPPGARAELAQAASDHEWDYAHRTVSRFRECRSEADLDHAFRVNQFGIAALSHAQFALVLCEYLGGMTRLRAGDWR